MQVKAKRAAAVVVKKKKAKGKKRADAAVVLEAKAALAIADPVDDTATEEQVRRSDAGPHLVASFVTRI